MLFARLVDFNARGLSQIETSFALFFSYFCDRNKIFSLIKQDSTQIGCDVDSLHTQSSQSNMQNR